MGRMGRRHRALGPDDSGTDAMEARLALGFRRLSITDLSEAGRQPMKSASGRSVILFNGEIYSAEELRADLPGHNVRGRSDTEVRY